MIKKQFTQKIYIYTDGGARGNPGPSSYGFVIYNNKMEEIFTGSQYLGIATNNQAEYRGVLGALNFIYSICEENKFETIPEIHFFLDSKLIVEQMNGRYKIKSDNLKTIYWQIREIILKLGGKIVFEHIPREKNKVADKLVNEEIDRNVSNKK